MQAPLTDLLRGGIPVLVVLGAAIAVIRIICRRPALRRRPLLLADPTVPERLSKTLARRQAEREEALHRAPTTQYEGPGVDRAGELLGLTRRFFGLMSGDPLARG